MTNKQLIERLNAYPLDANIIIRWEDFAISHIDDIEYDDERNEVCISHDCTA